MLKGVSTGVTIVVALSQCVFGGESVSSRAVIDFKAHPFDLAQVRLLDGPFKRAMELDRQYLLDLDPDRLLHMFRINAGFASTAQPLGGWEKPDCELRGHSLGHYLSACALMYASTGDETLRTRGADIVKTLARCQAALGRNGYLSAFPESWLDRAESLQRVWAPYYTLHKIYAGLLDMFVYCGNDQALAIAERMATWNKGRLDQLDPAHMQRMLNSTEQGGMNDVLANMYAHTGNRDYLKLSQRFNQKRYVAPLAQAQDRLKGEHVNSFIPNIIGTARQYELTGQNQDRAIVAYFWNQVVQQRSYCTGGTSNSEHWHSDPGHLATELGDHTQESCCTYNMLKLTRHLFCWHGDARYADYYERALYNSILSTQNPRTGMMMYFVPLATGRWKMYNLPNDSFWCCTGTGMENHAKYGDSIYFHHHRTLFVNLFIASDLDWRQQQVHIQQRTSFPEQDSTTLAVKTVQPTQFDLRVRVPAWAAQGALVRLNGKSLSLPTESGSYLSLNRIWHNSDRVEIRFPMHLYTHAMPDDPSLKAFMYGPLVLAGQLGGQGLSDENTHTEQNWYKFTQGVASVPPWIVTSDRVTDWIEPVADQPLTFRTRGLQRPITLVPYHRLFDQRYVVYWRVYEQGSPAHQAYLRQEQDRQALQARTVDQVKIGNPASEGQHDLQGDNTGSGLHQGQAWRHAPEGGWFSYRLRVLPDQPMILRCRYWGSDVGRRFDIIVGGQKVSTVTLAGDAPGKFFTKAYRIPPELTRGRDEIVVRFQAHARSTAGGVFGLAMLKASE